MSKQHTPALWHVEPSPDRVHFDIRADGVHLPLTEANARLMAAAPQLLAALIEARSLVDCSPNGLAFFMVGPNAARALAVILDEAISVAGGER